MHKLQQVFPLCFDSLYGILFDSGVAAVFYRLDLVEVAGYTETDIQDLTWDKHIEIGTAIKEMTGVC